MNKLRDSQISKVYKSELDVRYEIDNIGRNKFEKSFLSIEKTKISLQRILKSSWMKKYFPHVYCINIQLKDVRGNRRWARGGAYNIDLPLWARREIVILHELAHTILIRERERYGQCASHGKEWAGIFMMLLKRWNREVFELMKISYYLNRVKWIKNYNKLYKLIKDLR